MTQLIIGSFILSLIHASIPNHWIPIVMIGKAERWSQRETLLITAIAGSAHTFSTILIGIIVGMAGYKLSSTHEIITRIIMPSILVLFGIIYIIIDIKKQHHHKDLVNISSLSKKSKIMIITSLGLAMFFSPCIEIEAFFFTAGAFGWIGIGIVSVIYMVITVFSMMILVYLFSKGIKKIKWHFLEDHEKRITGIVLIIIGIIAYFIK
ncbi:MAG: sulfite exporter TauE/SafE family protein [Spirochaetes bacterium]|nr:sulfite exporter TauE/SafE family protein [Spirochaetota bacterium]